MFDLLSTAELTASSAIVVFFLASALSDTPRHRSWVATALAGWFCVVLLAGATGAFAYEGGIGVAGLGLAVVIPIAVLSLWVLGTARGRDLVARLPLETLVGVQAVRVLGITFILLYWAKRLPAPFAPVAGWGDVAVGLLAIPLGLLLARGPGSVPKALIVLWNVLGLTDLVVAVALGATSSPGPLQIFHSEPSSAIMSSLPWILIPCFLVPSLAFLHLCTFYRLRIWVPGERGEKSRSVRVAATGL
ncbi:MAG TPA: hypothetical protein VGM02_04040 [Acidobacteriaceae bacterium]|jgi:hypothetical protein